MRMEFFSRTMFPPRISLRHPFLTVFLLAVLSVSPAFGQKNKKSRGFRLLSEAVHALDKTGNYTASIQKKHKIEMTNRLYTRTKKIDGKLLRANSHLFLKRTSDVRVQRGKKEKTATNKVLTIGRSDPDQTFLTKRNDGEWKTFSSSVKKNSVQLKSYMARGIQERTLDLLSTASVEKEVECGESTCFLIKGTGDGDQIRSQLGNIYRSLGKNLKIKMKFKKKSFSFRVTKSDLNLQKFSTSFHIKVTMSNPRKPSRKRTQLQVIDTTYTFSDVGSTEIPESILKAYQKNTK